MKYYKVIVDGIITMIGSGSAVHESHTEITNDVDPLTGKEIEGSAERKYKELLEIFNKRPEDTFESVYYLDAETETYLSRPRTHDEVIDWYVQIVSIGTVTLDEIPQEYRAEVEARMPISEEQQWVNDIIAEVLA